MTVESPDDLGRWETDGGPPAPVPDRTADSQALQSPMADEIPFANIIRLECVGPRKAPSWVARLGPRDGGLQVAGATARQAIEAMALVADTCGWIYDETWRERDSEK